MKVLFDCRYTRFDRHDGISRYTTGLVTALARLHPVTMLISDERQLVMLPELPWILGSGVTSVKEPWIAYTVNRVEPDVVFSPMQTMGSLGRRYRLILTLHDLIYYTHRTPPREFPWPIKLLWRAYHLAYWPQRIVLGRGDAIVTVSETARRQIARHRLARRPITVVRDAVAQRTAVPREAPQLRSLVYMGSFMPYKRVETLLAAMHLLPGYRLHLLSSISQRDKARLSALAPAGTVIFEGGVSDERYQQLLSGATALVSASREEGFGIPVVEAMAAGTPVVLSDIPVFHEVGGDVALYFGHDDPNGFARAVLALQAPGEWSRRSSLAYDRAAEFTWERSAQTLLELARTLAGDR